MPAKRRKKSEKWWIKINMTFYQVSKSKFHSRLPLSWYLLLDQVASYADIFSRARPTLNLPCISPQNSVTCNGEYRRPVIMAQPYFPRCRSRWVSRWWIRHILVNGVIFSTLKHTDPHTVRRRSTQKDGVSSEHIFRNGSFRELKIAED